MARRNVALSKANAETEIRAVTLRLAHKPIAEIVAVLRERNISADPEFIRAVLKEA